MVRTPRPGRSEAGPSSPEGPTGEGSSVVFAGWLLLGLTIVGVLCDGIGRLRFGLGWRDGLSAASCQATGIGFVAIGMLEVEWLERIMGYGGGWLGGLGQWLWSGDSLSDSLGRRNASVTWVLIGFPIFIAGCLIALRIIGA